MGNLVTLRINFHSLSTNHLDFRAGCKGIRKEMSLHLVRMGNVKLGFIPHSMK